MKKTILLSLIVLFSTTLASAQTGVAVNSDGSDADASAILDLKASGKGILVPRMELESRPVNPATGLLIYQTNETPGFYYNKGTADEPQWTYLGAQGMPGESGAKGEQGLKGETGLQGLEGPEGSKGAQGETGEQGLQGLTGPAGPKGDAGATGPTGPMGMPGMPGMPGFGMMGPMGLTGPQGIQGIQGIQGTAGSAASVYSFLSSTSVNPVSSAFYIPVNGFNSTSTAYATFSFVATTVPYACKIDVLRLTATTSGGSGTANMVVTLYKNGAATSLSVSFTSAASGSSITVQDNDPSHTVSLAAGDTIAYYVTQTATTPIVRLASAIRYQ